MGGQLGFFRIDGVLKSVGSCVPAAACPVCACAEPLPPEPCPIHTRFRHLSNEALLAIGAGAAVMPSWLVGIMCGLCLSPALRRPRRDISTQTHHSGQPAWTQTKPPVQLPLDLVCCVDCGPSVTQMNFRKAITFITGLCEDLEMPPTRVGVLIFNHNCTVLARLGCTRQELQFVLRGALYQPGDTKLRLAPTLVKAAEMLSLPLEGQKGAERKKAVIIISEGEPDDLPEAERVAALLRQDLTQVVCAGIGVKKHSCAKLASMPTSRCAFGVRSYHELRQLEASMISALVETTRARIVTRNAEVSSMTAHGTDEWHSGAALACWPSPAPPKGVPPVLNFNSWEPEHQKASKEVKRRPDDKEVPMTTVLEEPMVKAAVNWNSLRCAGCAPSQLAGASDRDGSGQLRMN